MSGSVVWLTGLPSSGKTTLARALAASLKQRRRPVCLLDGDVMRSLISPELGYSDADRAKHYALLGRLAAELAHQGLVVLVPATAHRREYRAQARALAPHFLEVWVTTPLEECEQRDDKGLYAVALEASGHMPGIDLLYEPPERAEVLASGGQDTGAIERVCALLPAEG